MYVQQMDPSISLNIYLLTNLVGFKWTFIFTVKESMCVCVCVLERKIGGGGGDCEAH